MSENSSLLSAVNVDKYFGGVHAVDHFSIEVHRSQIVGLIGPNGSGKTTVFNLITGIVGADSGHIYFRGREITSEKPHTITGAGIGRTFQNIRLFQGLNVIDNIKAALCHNATYTFYGAILGTPRMRRVERELTNMAEKLLERVQLQEHATDRPQSLPYGLQRRLEIARALAVRPELLLLDEPAAGLNPSEILEITQLIRRLRDEMNVTILLIEHHMDVIMPICEEVHVLNMGRTIGWGTPHQVQNHPEVLRAYLGD